MKAKREGEPTRTITVRVPVSLVERLERAAALLPVAPAPMALARALMLHGLDRIEREGTAFLLAAAPAKLKKGER
jgi:hypothetical protein